MKVPQALDVLGRPTVVSPETYLAAINEVVYFTINKDSCEAVRNDPSTSTLDGIKMKDHCLEVLTQYFTERVQATIKLANRKLIPDFAGIKVTSADQYLVFRVPFLATTGWNQAWATYGHLHSDEPQPSVGSSDYVGGPEQKKEFVA